MCPVSLLVLNPERNQDDQKSQNVDDQDQSFDHQARFREESVEENGEGRDCNHKTRAMPSLEDSR